MGTQIELVVSTSLVGKIVELTQSPHLPVMMQYSTLGDDPLFREVVAEFAGMSIAEALQFARENRMGFRGHTWGDTEILAAHGEVEVRVLSTNAGKETSLHYHPIRTESQTPLLGDVEVTVDKTAQRIQLPGGLVSFTIPQQCWHRFKASPNSQGVVLSITLNRVEGDTIRDEP